MKVLLFGATGMIGQAALRECLLDSQVTEVIAVGRSSTGQRHPKLQEIVHGDMTNIAPVLDRVGHCYACLFCLGISSLGLSEADYAKVTHDLTFAVASALASRAPHMTFVYVSALGTDSSENGRIMWARVRGRTENDLFRLPFAKVFSVRPGFIQPVHGIESRTAFVRRFYKVLAPVVSLARALLPERVITSEEIGRAMINISRDGWPSRILEAKDIKAASKIGD